MTQTNRATGRPVGRCRVLLLAIVTYASGHIYHRNDHKIIAVSLRNERGWATGRHAQLEF